MHSLTCHTFLTIKYNSNTVSFNAGSRGRAWGARASPFFLDQTEARKKFFCDPPPYLRVGWPAPPPSSEGMDSPLSLTGPLKPAHETRPTVQYMGSYETNPYIQGGVYSSFKAMEMIQGILGFEIFSSGILEGRGREILENIFWGVDVLSQDFLKHLST